MRLSVWLVVLLSASALTQQPPLRIRLLTLYHLQQITIVPRSLSYIDQNRNRRQLHSSIPILAQGDLVDLQGRTSSRLVLSGEFEITGDQMRPETVHVPLEISAHHGELEVIGLYPMEEYVAAAMQGETAGDMPPEALKALAVAVRSYATKFRDRHKSESFDFCDTTHCQFLRTEISPKVLAAVKATENQLLWDRGTPLAAYYHKDCGGRTEDVAVVWPDQRSPALISHEDIYCKRTSRQWRSDIARVDVSQALAAASLQVPQNWDRIIVRERTASGRARILSFSVGGSQQSRLLSASSFRFALGRKMGWNTLKSDWYEITASGDHFIFTGRGTGHGVGLCQQGAAEMAREGKSYREILSLYYPSAEIGRSAQGIAWKRARSNSFDIQAVNSADIPSVAPAARRAIIWAESETNLELKTRPVLEVYPTVEMFRNATGEPGWVAASTRGGRIRLEPPSIVKGEMQNLLRHEFLHLLIESNTKTGTPLWFREGLVLEITGETGSGTPTMTPEQIDEAVTSRRSEAEVKKAYAEAGAMVQQLERKHGRPKLMRWLRDGIPSDVLAVQAHAITQ